MLQNINILAGRIPQSTGNTDQDLKALMAFTQRLVRALEKSIDILDSEDEKLRQRIEKLEKK